MSHLFREYAPFKGEIEGRNRGVMVSMEPGTSTAYALNNIQERGRLFIGPQEDVYAGMIVGENARPEDLPVNPCKAKHLTNMRSQGDGKGIQLEAPLRMSLERAIEYIDSGRVRGGDAEIPPSAQAHPRRDRPKTGRRGLASVRLTNISATIEYLAGLLSSPVILYRGSVRNWQLLAVRQLFQD